MSADEKEKTVPLHSPPAGRPVIGEKYLLLPLRKGSVVRVSLPPDGSEVAVEGPPWRSNRRSPENLCHVAWLGPDSFLTTDGNRALAHWIWKPGDTWQLVCENATDETTTQLTARIITAPAVLPRGEKGELRVVVADATGKLILLTGDKLEAARHWNLGGRVTAGPFLRGRHVGCVIDRRRVIWIDPDKSDLLWQYESGDEVVGEPQVAGKVVVIADQAGRFTGLDPKTGRPLGRGYRLKANVAPAAAPVAFGPDQVFAPLTDGTVLLLGMDFLCDPFDAFPIVW